VKEKNQKAVSIRYNQSDFAPKVVAKGKGAIASKIIALAKEIDIPLYEDPNLVEILYLLDVGYEIPEKLYTAVAEILAFVYFANEKYHALYEAD